MIPGTPVTMNFLLLYIYYIRTVCSFELVINSKHAYIHMLWKTEDALACNKTTRQT